VAGAGIGGVAGAVLTNGSALGTVGGAAVGGIIGDELSTGGHGNRDGYWDRQGDETQFPTLSARSAKASRLCKERMSTITLPGGVRRDD
jgi:hypothetical protein